VPTYYCECGSAYEARRKRAQGCPACQACHAHGTGTQPLGNTGKGVAFTRAPDPTATAKAARLANLAMSALGSFDPGTGDDDDHPPADDGVDHVAQADTTREEMLECCRLCGELIPDHRAQVGAARYCSQSCAQVGALIKAPSIGEQCLAGRLPREWVTITYKARGAITGNGWRRPDNAAAEDLAGTIDPSEYEA